MDSHELEKILDVDFPTRQAGPTWYANDPELIHDADNQCVRIKFDSLEVLGEVTQEGVKPMGSTTHGPGIKAALVSITKGTLIGPDGAETLKPGRYVVLSDRFAYGSPLGWRGEIILPGLSD